MQFMMDVGNLQLRDGGVFEQTIRIGDNDLWVQGWVDANGTVHVSAFANPTGN